MKNLCLLLLLVFASQLMRAEEASIQRVPTYIDTNPSETKVFVAFRYGQTQPIDKTPLLQLTGMKIESVKYIYSAYRTTTKERQLEVDEKRWESVTSSLKDFHKSNLQYIEQTECNDLSCAQTKFHGFEIRFTNPAVFSQQQLTPKVWELDPNKTQQFRLPSGTEIHIEANSFEDQFGNPVTEPIQFIIREGITPKEMVLGGLYTITQNGEVLESAGMVYTEARSNGKMLKLRAGKTIGIGVLADSLSPRMELYDGVEEQQQLSWTNPVPLEKKEMEEEPKNIQYHNSKYGTYSWWVNHTDNLLGMRLIMGKKLEDTVVMEFQNEDYTYLQTPPAMELKDTVKTIGIFEHYAELHFGKNYAVQFRGIPPFREDGLQRYAGQLSRMGWCNLDQIWRSGEPEFVTLDVEVPGGDHPSCQVSLVVTRGGRSVYIQGMRKNDGGYFFGMSRTMKYLPVAPGTEAHVMVLNEETEEPSFAMQRLVLEEHNNIQLEPLAQSPEQIRRTIDRYLP